MSQGKLQIPTDVPVYVGVRFPTAKENFSGVVFAKLNKYWRTTGGWSGKPEPGHDPIEQVVAIGFQPNVTIILDADTAGRGPIVELLELRGAKTKTVSFSKKETVFVRISQAIQSKNIVDDNGFWLDPQFLDAFVVGAAAIIEEFGTIIEFPGRPQ